MKERFHNVYRFGDREISAGMIGRVDREAAARVTHWPRDGIWRVVDHTDTIEALCGPWGRAE